MKATLTPRWELTDKSAVSGAGQPVLINLITGEAFGPGDLVQPCPERTYLRVTLAVHRLAQAADLDPMEPALVARFVVRPRGR